MHGMRVFGGRLRPMLDLYLVGGKQRRSRIREVDIERIYISFNTVFLKGYRHSTKETVVSVDLSYLSSASQCSGS